MKRIIMALTVALSAISMQAKVTLPEIIGDDMVLQQNTNARLWGNAAPKAIITVTPSWNGISQSVKADKNGHWLIEIPTPDASFTEHTITISDGESVTLKGVLVGEVWFCSGQSNMEMPMNGFWNCPIEGSNEIIAQSGQWKGIRMVTIPKNGMLKPVDNVSGTWKRSNPENSRWFSATAYYFAMYLSATLDIPVGIINCSWGGSRVEGWLPEEIVRGYKDINYDVESQMKEQTWWHYHNVTMMYNGMYYPIRKYSVKGFLWYQGESNVGKHDSYPERFNTLVGIWRENQGTESPVYLVELAPWLYGGDGTSGARFREAQLKMSQIIPNCGMITTNDLVYPDEDTQIHPRNKKDVGQRLAWMALNNTYGMKGIEGWYPTYKEVTFNGDTAEISFNNAEDGFSPWKGLNGFEIAGADKVFHSAKAWVNTDHKTIMVRSEEVKEPIAVRYCFRDFQIGNLVNGRDMPVIPFRTDNW